jgi:F-type H+-transporting ATPase subunit epsilon
MNVEIITPDSVLFSGEAKRLQLPGTEGSFEILNDHAPIISTLKPGNIKVSLTNGTVETLAVQSGVVELQGNKVIVLATV